MRKPSAATVIATVALFVALSGVGVAATGGNFILGKPDNTADKTTGLASGVTTGPTLELKNSGGSPAARFNTPNGVAPFVVSNGTKIANLNADKLDGFDSEYFLPKSGKAADADKLDGINSTGFIQGVGNAYQRRIRVVPPDGDPVTQTVLTIPGLGEVVGVCDLNLASDVSKLSFHNSSGESLAVVSWKTTDPDGSNSSMVIPADGSADIAPLSSSPTIVILQLGTDAKAATVVASKNASGGSCYLHANAAKVG